MKPFARINLSSVLPSVALAKVDALRRGILVSSLALAAGCVSGPKVNNAPVSALDLNRYLGEWYEIARFDHSFERGVEQAKAKYSLKDDGTIEVVNSGIKNGKSKTAVGKGKTTDTPGLLRVSFFGPFYADYRVMLIDKDYSRALVGSGSADYLWILSRTSGLSETAKSELLSRNELVGDKEIGACKFCPKLYAQIDGRGLCG